MKKIYREPLDSALVNMGVSAMFKKNGLFYFSMIKQMRIILTEDIPAPAGVSFSNTHYNLYINIPMFKEYSLEDRIFILIHECMHILLGHVGMNSRLSGKNINHHKSNLSEDCALNQLIQMKAPESAIMPNNLLKDKSIIVKSKQTAEFYYNLLKDNEPSIPENPDDGSNFGDSDNSGDSSDSSNSGKSGKSGNVRKKLDTHSTWSKSEGNADLQKDLTSRMINKAIEETTKSQGSLPGNIEEIVDIFKRKAQIDWKKALRNLVGNKKVGKRPTIMRKSRRFLNRPDIKGHTKDRTFTLVVAIDTSGSMDTEKDILIPLNEISSICKMTNTDMKMLQVDTEIKNISTFNKKSKSFKRNGFGGTRMEPVIDYLKENKIKYDGILFLSDMYIEELSEWKLIPKQPIFWISSTPLDKGVQVQKYPRQKRFFINTNITK